MPSATSSAQHKSYTVLGLDEGASLDEVRAAYKKLALKWHPDRIEHDKEYAAEKFVEIHQAYDLLTAEIERPSRTSQTSSKPPRASHAKAHDAESQKPTDVSKFHEPSKHSSRPYDHPLPSKFPRTRYATVPDDRFPIPATTGKDKTPAEQSSSKRPSPKPEVSTSISGRKDEPPKPKPKPESTPRPPRREKSTRPSNTPLRHSDSNVPHSKHPNSHSDHSDNHSSWSKPSKTPSVKSYTTSFSSSHSTRSDPGKDPHTRHHRPSPPHRPCTYHESSNPEKEKKTPSHKHSSSPFRDRDRDKDKDIQDEFFDYVHLSKRDALLDLPLDPIASTKPAPTHSPTSESSSTPKTGWVFPLDVTLEELYHGTTRHYRISTSASQAGSTPDDEKAQSVKIHIPAGTFPGTRIHALPNVTFEVRETPHAYFSRVDRASGDVSKKKDDTWGTDLYMCLELPWAGVDELKDELKDAHVVFTGVDGKEMRVPTPVDLIAATSGSRVLGKGMPVCEDGKVMRHGDLYIRWDFFVPDKARPTQTKWDSIKNAIQFKF